MLLTPHKRHLVILVLTGLLAACGTNSSPDVGELSAQGLKNFQAAPLTKVQTSSLGS